MKNCRLTGNIPSALSRLPTIAEILPPSQLDVNPFNLYDTSRDDTERNSLEQELRIAATTFEAQEGILILDHDKLILRANYAFTRLSGYSAKEVIGKSTQIFCSSYHEPAFYEEIWRQTMQRGYWCGEMHARHKSGETHPIWSTLTAVKGSDGAITHYVSTATDMARRRGAEREIKRLAFHDPLSGLGNRRLLIDCMQQALIVSRRDDSLGAVLFIDLDNFKTLNDAAGHDIGDLILVQVARRLSTCVREGDTVAHLGGDDFAIVLTNLSPDAEQAILLAEQCGQHILAVLNSPYDLDGRSYYISPSIGVTLFGSEQESVANLLRRADLAMYQAKSHGGNTVRMFDPAVQTAVTARAELEEAMRHGLQRKEFILYYQPQIDSAGKATGAEALVRWQHPQHGLIPPSEFISLAEEIGLIVPLGLQLLEIACQQMVEWEARADLGEFTISVNVSSRQFQQPDFVEQVLRTLKDTGADPHRLKLELTESLLLDNVDDTIAKMTALREHGIGFSLDDFGTGYSSLSYLKRLPLDQLKIDQSFVSSVLVDANDAAIAKMIVTLGKSLGLNLIAEGVETEEQRIFLDDCGCHAYQGYLFGSPMPAKCFENFLRGIACSDLKSNIIQLNDRCRQPISK